MKTWKLPAVAMMTLLVGSTLARADEKLTLTSHVPESVSLGKATRVGHLDDTKHMSLAISLPQRNQDDLDNFLADIYNRNSPNFRHYLSVEEFTKRFGPSDSDYAALVQFARSHGLTVDETFDNRMVVDVGGKPSDIEKAFHVTLGVYQHPTENRTFYAPDREPTLDLDVPVLHIAGLDNFKIPHSRLVKADENAASSRTTGSGPGGAFVASDIRAAYYGTGSLNGSGQSVGLFELEGYELSDVQKYFKNLNQPLNVPVVGVSLNGASLSCSGSCDDTEQVLDIDQAIGMAPGLKQVTVYVGNTDVSIFNRMVSDNSSKQLSSSWAASSTEAVLDPIFKEMAAQGQTMFVASGDEGAASTGQDTWPADDPYVIAVGGTDLTTVSAGGAWKSETGWSGSAGGPSTNKAPIPSYQLIAGVITTANKGSKTLRNIPDVAAEGNTNQYVCADGGTCNGGNGGTSFASPQWAGFAALVNQQAEAQGKSTVGFFNSTIYNLGVSSSYDSNFHDIVKGSNGSNGKYNAGVGFDLVTGWGSPKAELIGTLISGE